MFLGRVGLRPAAAGLPLGPQARVPAPSMFPPLQGRTARCVRGFPPGRLSLPLPPPRSCFKTGPGTGPRVRKGHRALGVWVDD